MRFKYYLRGCGLGILIASIILMICFHLKGGVMTDEKAMERASELGMIMPEETEEASENLLATQEVTQTAEPTVKPDTQTEEKEKEKDTEKEKKKDTKKEEKKDEDETIMFKVSKGEVCRNIAENLYKAGMVDDAEKFRKYMQENDYDNLICVGVFELKLGMTYKQIAEKLTAKPE